jgi:hypothetical protein
VNDGYRRTTAAELQPAQWAQRGATWHEVARRPEYTDDGWLRVWWAGNPLATLMKPGTDLTVADIDPRPQNTGSPAHACDDDTVAT